MTDTELGGWLKAYGAAWESRSPDAAAALFTEDALYYETPFTEPARGRDGIRAYWSTATGNQRDISFLYEILALTQNQGIVRWRAQYLRSREGTHRSLDGVFVLKFDDTGLCRELREWWHGSSS